MGPYIGLPPQPDPPGTTQVIGIYLPYMECLGYDITWTVLGSMLRLLQPVQVAGRAMFLCLPVRLTVLVGSPGGR